MALATETAKTRRVYPPRAGLGNIGIFASSFQYREKIEKNQLLKKSGARFRWFLSMLQRRMLWEKGALGNFRSLINCCSKPIPSQTKRKDGSWVETGAPGVITVGETGMFRESDKNKNSNGLRYGYKWMQHCHSPMLCFVCAPKIRYVRSQEIKEICESMYEQGYRWLFVTFTAPHYFNQSPKKQIKQFQDAVRRLKSGRWFKDFKEDSGYIGQITGTELTVPMKLNQSAGCHWHHHAIVFFDRKEQDFSKEEAEAIQAQLSKRWVECLQKAGVEARSAKGWKDVARRGINVKCPRARDKGEAAAQYASKGAACELSPGIFTKLGRKVGNVSHWEFMAHALIKGDEAEKARALEIMLALKGRHWLHVSPAIKTLSGIQLQTDEEIMRDERKTEDIYEFSHEDWLKLDKYKMQREVLEAFEQMGGDFGDLVQTVVRGFHPLTGEPLETARQLKEFLLLERLRAAKPPGPSQ